MEYFSSDDIQPPVKAFDDYTVNEKIDVANTYFAKEIPICPKDQTSLEISYQEHSGGRAMGVRCPRCGRIYQWDNHLDSINRSRKVNE
jgi:tRNA(Ile2) C34 agmatinyltransferase TiaS